MDMFDFSENSKSYKITITALGALTLIALAIAMIPSLKEKAQALINNPERIILSKSSAPLNPGGPFLTVFKIKTIDGLFIEIYEESSDSPRLLARLSLDGTRDGFFNFQNQATNLAMTDVNEDGYIDIVAPTFDDQQQARMNVFRYDLDILSFVRMEKN